MKTEILSQQKFRSAIKRLSHEILENVDSSSPLAIIGVKTRGVYLAQRFSSIIKEISNVTPSVGNLDVTFYRDDLSSVIKRTKLVGKTSIPFSCKGKQLILVDDVLQTGRTIRAALSSLVNFGRPKFLRLAVMVDRGMREFPVKADFVGKNLSIGNQEVVKVLFKEIDGTDGIVSIA
ncbi:MAG: bifunctional pyr operon transcriptional regulator/uracil phosphoribosyltransferase PyrR [Nitrospinota bacterium]|nr:bifunctional pyr operon transcriptional regulator/uracil phosphoribosyltransferase PyrR [Nitrospinota bacterium]